MIRAFRCLLCAVIAIIAIQSTALAAPANPAAIWGFEEGSGTTVADSSGNGNTGILGGSALWSTGLVGDHALELPAHPPGWMETSGPVVDTSKSYTVFACVKLNRLAGYQTFVGIDGSALSAFFLQLRGDSGEFAFVIPKGDSLGAPSALVYSDVDVRSGVWYDLAGVYDASVGTFSLYVDGQLQGTSPISSAWRASGRTSVGRGHYERRRTDYCDGEIDDVRLYQSALTADDIRAVAQADLPESSILPLVPPAPPIANLSIDAAQDSAHVSPTFYGLMTEEINHSYDGGLYGELIQNRSFLDDPTDPVHWTVTQVGAGAAGTIALDPSQPLSRAQTVSLKLTIAKAHDGARVGAANDGYWGIPIRPRTRYKLLFYAKSGGGFAGRLAATIESGDGSKVYAVAQSQPITSAWARCSLVLNTGADVKASATNRLVISAGQPGTVWIDLVSLFPPTYNNRPNGDRIDLMQKLAALKPTFLRLPGGNYLEGDTIDTRFEWKKTIGPLTERPGHQGPWGYRSSDGMGLLEFLEWCEDLHIQPILAVYAGYSLKGAHIDAGSKLEPFVQDALDEIEYVTGGMDTRWGAERARDGHPAPFSLTYVEIGNEDWFDRSGSYGGRFAQFFDAIKARYPKLQLIATMGVASRTPDVIDEHYYRSERAFENDAHHYDSYNRKGPKIFVGEWATEEGQPTPDLNGALGDAVWMTAMERNSDIVVISSYAPLFVNVSNKARQWGTNLIGYDALRSYGSPSYYVQKMFSTYLGDRIVPTTLSGGRHIFESVTRNSKSGTIYVKLVNASAIPQTVHTSLTGVHAIAPDGASIVLSGAHFDDTNSIDAPTRIIPVKVAVHGLGTTFDYRIPARAVVVLMLKAK